MQPWGYEGPAFRRCHIHQAVVEIPNAWLSSDDRMTLYDVDPVLTVLVVGGNAAQSWPIGTLNTNQYII